MNIILAKSGRFLFWRKKSSGNGIQRGSKKIRHRFIPLDRSSIMKTVDCMILKKKVCRSSIRLDELKGHTKGYDRDHKITWCGREKSMMRSQALGL